MNKSKEEENEILDFVIENGSLDIEINNEFYSIYCEVKDYHELIKKITEKFCIPKSNQIIWKTDTKINLELERAKQMFNLIKVLEDNDDVQHVSSNFEITDEIMNQLIKQKGILGDRKKNMEKKRK